MSSYEARTATLDPAKPIGSLGSVAVFVVLLGVFFLSGASALIYEVVWTRLLALVFGVTLYAISAVLASFMAGLALGSYLAGRLADRSHSPLLVYAGLEIGIAILGLGSLPAIKFSTPIYVWLFAITGDSAALATSARFLGACIILLLPTSLMGATLPFMVRASLQFLPKLGENLSLLYALNTAGAAAGTLAAGFVLIGELGLYGAVYVAAGLNLAAGLVALGLARFMTPMADSLDTAPGGAAGSSRAGTALRRAQGERDFQSGREGDFHHNLWSPATTAVLVAFGLSGWCALAYEVIWFRILDLFFNGTVYAFSIMLSTFLVGLAVGSAVSRAFIGRPWNWIAVLGGLEVGIGLQAISTHVTVPQIPAVRDALLSVPALSPLLERPVFAMALVGVLILLPLAVILGMTFPVAAQALATERHSVGTLIGRLNAANTVGAILGSLAGGFWLLPVLGSSRSLTLLAAVNIGVGLLLLQFSLDRRVWFRWALPLTAAVALLPGFAPDFVPSVLSGLFKNHEMLWHEEGLENTVSVQKQRTLGHTFLYLNSRGQASDEPGLVRFHQFIGHLPMLLHPDPKDALVIGLGGGATPGAISRYGETQVDVVELSPSVVRAAGFFGHINNSILVRSNARIIVDDGRNYLLLTRKKYDVITADLILSHHAGAGNLYSAEYFTLVKAALQDDGIMAQWADIEAPSYHLIARTFMSVFPYVTFWEGGTVLIGSKQPLDLTPQTIQRRLDRPGARAGVEHVGARADDVLRRYTDDKAAFSRLLGEGLLLTDDRPLTEYFRSAPR